MMWLALTLYCLPVAAALRHFDDECDMVREEMMDEGMWWPALIAPVALAMILLWPLVCLEAILSPPEGNR